MWWMARLGRRSSKSTFGAKKETNNLMSNVQTCLIFFKKKKKILVPAGVILMSNVQTCLIFLQARSSSGNAHPLQRQNSPRAGEDTDFFFLGEEVIYEENGLEKN